jgi:bifunctional NMN adenylyltransferase/nudix hydrolase
MRKATLPHETAVSYDVAVVIGRFQPPHREHDRLLQHALSIAERVVVILGSAFHARSIRNPFTAAEREIMLRGSLTEAQADRVSFVPLRDYYDEERWALAVRERVAAAAPNTHSVALVGNFKDASSEYLDDFSEWSLVSTSNFFAMDATSVRDVLFTASDPAIGLLALREVVSPFVHEFLLSWVKLPHYQALREEWDAVADGHQRFPQPYSVTADAVVTNGDRVLLIRRRKAPGKGLWAIPGGFVDSRERVDQAAMRELVEETQLGLNRGELRRSLVNAQVFDHPDRSVRGRVFTHAFHFDLRLDRDPEVAGGDDAADAQWVPVADLASMEGQFYDDHFHILNYFLGLV